MKVLLFPTPAEISCTWMYLRVSSRQSRIWFLFLRTHKRNRGHPLEKKPNQPTPKPKVSQHLSVETHKTINRRDSELVPLTKKGLLTELWGAFELTFNYWVNDFACKFCHTLLLIKSFKAGNLASCCSACAFTQVLWRALTWNCADLDALFRRWVDLDWP